MTLHTAHFVTPETETSCHYFWSVGRNYNVDDIAVTGAMHAEFKSIFSEDVEIVEAQQKSLDNTSVWQPIDVNADAPVLQARQLLKKFISAETDA